jgi:hypothetical protein
MVKRYINRLKTQTDFSKTDNQLQKRIGRPISHFRSTEKVQAEISETKL